MDNIFETEEFEGCFKGIYCTWYRKEVIRCARKYKVKITKELNRELGTYISNIGGWDRYGSSDEDYQRVIADFFKATYRVPTNIIGGKLI